MITILIIIAVYVLSCLGAYKFIQKAHYEEKGKFKTISPTRLDVCMIFLPFINCIMTADYIFGNWRKKEDKTVDFFKPKNK